MTVTYSRVRIDDITFSAGARLQIQLADGRPMRMRWGAVNAGSRWPVGPWVMGEDVRAGRYGEVTPVRICCQAIYNKEGTWWIMPAGMGLQGVIIRNGYDKRVYLVMYSGEEGLVVRFV